eukprot:GFYU01011409.1.p1 GENE.GFYU01011409.1~~GFYU01011409.1.p1  ORF type:complete len:123 (-),score=18.28 GFYU01011409.1:475-843(-)
MTRSAVATCVACVAGLLALNGVDGVSIAAHNKRSSLDDNGTPPMRMRGNGSKITFDEVYEHVAGQVRQLGQQVDEHFKRENSDVSPVEEALEAVGGSEDDRDSVSPVQDLGKGVDEAEGDRR